MKVFCQAKFVLLSFSKEFGLLEDRPYTSCIQTQDSSPHAWSSVPGYEGVREAAVSTMTWYPLQQRQRQNNLVEQRGDRQRYLGRWEERALLIPSVDTKTIRKKKLTPTS